MSKFIYVQALVSRVVEDCDSIRFRHTVIEAENADAAYAAGGRWSDANPPYPEDTTEQTTRTLGALPGYRPDLETINDYVIPLP